MDPFEVESSCDGLELIYYIADRFPLYTISTLRKFIEMGGVYVNNKKVSPAEILKTESLVELREHLPQEEFFPVKIPMDILYEDEDLLVISKPSGIPTVPARKDSVTILEGLLHTCAGKFRPHIIHRLDQGTSGVMVVGKNRKSAASLTSQFVDRTIDKEYLAFVQGTPYPSDGKIDFDIEDPQSGKKKKALTEYRLLEKFRTVSLLSVEPHTGRMHQIRIHLSKFGYPLLVDPEYKGKKEFFLSEIKSRYKKKEDRPESPIIDRLTLHAHKLSFVHPQKQEKMTFTAPFPPDLERLHKVLKKYGR